METLERIQLLMKQKGVNKTIFLKALGLNKSTWSDWESEKSESYLKYIAKIAQYFNVSADYLLGLTEAPTPPPQSLTREDKLKVEIAKLTPEKLMQAERFVEFLKTEEEFSQELSDALSMNGMKPQTE